MGRKEQGKGTRDAGCYQKVTDKVIKKKPSSP